MNCLLRFSRAVCCFGLVVFCFAGTAVRADVSVPKIFADNMVLQRDQAVPVWGKASAGEKVTVSIGDAEQSTTAGDDGKWMVKLPALKAGGGALEMTIAGKNSISIRNILVGEVWVCSGQSNMEWSMTRALNAEEEISDAKHPNIRLFHVKKVPQAHAQDDVVLTSSWKECSPESVPNFSAVAYFFGRHLHQELDVPIGLINTSWGGTRIEPWTPPVGFKHVPKLESILKVAKDLQDGKSDAKINARTPTALYNGMVDGLVPYGIRGAIWYQGESNRADGMMYYEKKKALISGWRKVWNQGEFPFLFVQLAPYQYGKEADDVLPKAWEAQTASLKIPNTGMAVTVDIGNTQDIHPKNKQDVGKRLALWALAKTYGKKGIVYSGPLFKSMAVEGNAIRIKFKHAKSGLKSRDGKPLSWFTIAGKDGAFVAAKAEIDGKSVVVSSDAVSNPTAVRFGWNKIAEPNLSNEAGLPASPFRTDW